MQLYVDTATTHFWAWNKPVDHPAQPYLLRLAVILEDDGGTVVDRWCHLVLPLPTWPEVSFAARRQHGIGAAEAAARGKLLGRVMRQLEAMLPRAPEIIGHGAELQRRVLGRAFATALVTLPRFEPGFCTMKNSADAAQAGRLDNGQWRWPTLAEAHRALLGTDLPAMADPIAAGLANVDAVRKIHNALHAPRKDRVA